jgi:deoxyhypusine monooxygenase
MRHELAYVIGQFQDAEACPTLEAILADETDDSMVRHEAAEALGTIGNVRSLGILKKFSQDEAPEVSETCALALRLVQYKQSTAVAEARDDDEDECDDNLLDRNPYLSHDPAPAMQKSKTTQELQDILLDSSRSMFDRYRAMFSLRNRNTEEAALVLCICIIFILLLAPLSHASCT